jgi:hypothetical protein
MNKPNRKIALCAPAVASHVARRPIIRSPFTQITAATHGASARLRSQAALPTTATSDTR